MLTLKIAPPWNGGRGSSLVVVLSMVSVEPWDLESGFSSRMVWWDAPEHWQTCSMLTAGGGWSAIWSARGWISPTWSANLALRASWYVVAVLASPKGRAITPGVCRAASDRSGSKGGQRWARVSRADSVIERQLMSFRLTRSMDSIRSSLLMCLLW